MSKKIKIFLSLIFLLSVVVTVGIFFDFDFKKLFLKSKIFPSENKKTVISNITPTPSPVLEFVELLHLPEGSLDLSLPVERNYFEAMKENTPKYPDAISFNLNENEEIKAIFDGKIASVQYVNKETIEGQPNDFLRIWIESRNEILVAIYLVAGEFLLKENEEIKSGESLARIGKGIVPFNDNANFSLTIMKLEEDNYKTIALDKEMFLR